MLPSISSAQHWLLRAVPLEALWRVLQSCLCPLSRLLHQHLPSTTMVGPLGLPHHPSLSPKTDGGGLPHVAPQRCDAQVPVCASSGGFDIIFMRPNRARQGRSPVISNLINVHTRIQDRGGRVTCVGVLQ